MVDEHPDSAEVTQTRVLMVDSNEASRAVLRAALEAEGYSVLEATNGVDAIVIVYIARERLVVVVDTYLSDMDGEDFLQLVTHDPHLVARHGYVFLAEVAAAPSAVTARFLARHGIVALTKPYTREAFADAVAEAALRPASPVR